MLQKEMPSHLKSFLYRSCHLKAARKFQIMQVNPAVHNDNPVIQQRNNQKIYIITYKCVWGVCMHVGVGGVGGEQCYITEK